mmetsp:Transcript_38300/g.126838  ORF Transcript_38300/g.126838 Transcript_38300/m.126838 type:complete len:144 (-) Transcript_38300:30-461(-)
MTSSLQARGPWSAGARAATQAGRRRERTRGAMHVAAALGAAFGSRPPEQLSQRVKLIFCALMVILTLSADSILSVRGGDPRFLVGQICFNAPMVIAFWLTAPPGSRKLKQPVAKQIVQAVLMRGPRHVIRVFNSWWGVYSLSV